MSHFDWQAVPTLDTPRLHLRGVNEADSAALFTIYGDAEVMEFASDPPFPDEASIGVIFANIGELFAEHTVLQWGIILRATGQLIGTCEIHSITADSAVAEIGCLLARAYWGQGIMPEVLRAIIRFGFAELGIQTLRADIDVGNARSRALFQRLGFVPVPESESSFTLANPAQP